MPPSVPRFGLLRVSSVLGVFAFNGMRQGASEVEGEGGLFEWIRFSGRLPAAPLRDGQGVWDHLEKFASFSS